MPDLSVSQWALALVAAMGIGISKSGFPGVGLFHVVVFAQLFGEFRSTGIVLPMLLVGDVSAIAMFRQHARWEFIAKMLPPALVGIVVGWYFMEQVPEDRFKFMLGSIILLLAVLQVVRTWRPNLLSHVPHSWWFAWTLGLLAGFTTMLANAAGPIMALYLLAVALPKFEYVGTSAWFFFIVNLIKIPFSARLGLIDDHTLVINVTMIPSILLGFVVGQWLIKRASQRVVDTLLLTFAGIVALKLTGLLGLVGRWCGVFH